MSLSWKNAALWLAITVTLCVISGTAGAALSGHFGTSNYTISYADFISVLLTSITLLITLLAIFLAIVGVIGWNSISSNVRDRTENYLLDGFKEGNRLHRILEKHVNTIMFAGVTPVENRAEADDTEEEEVE